MDDIAVAVKWIQPSWATPDYRRALESLASMGAPDARFLWPTVVVTDTKHKGFGYVMPLRSDRFRTIGAVVGGEVSPPVSVRARAGREFVSAFRLLHSKGLCYRDISDDNIALDPRNGDICIADNDNVAVDGQGTTAIAGTPGFSAPEIVRCETAPTADTDLWSLAVLLFHLLFNAHPLEGARDAAIHCKDRDAIVALYGHPLFIFDPADSSNRPVPGLHDGVIRLWQIYPSRLRELFVRAFTSGRVPGKRVRGSEWRNALIELEDSVQRCECGAENLVDLEVGSARFPCWRCHKRLHEPLLLLFDTHSAVLNIGKVFYAHHLAGARSVGDESAVGAEVTRAPGGAAALLNRSIDSWEARTPSGESAAVAPGQKVQLQTGLTINFGARSARIE